MDVQVELVDQIQTHEGRGEIGTADQHVPAGPRLESADVLDGHLAYDGRVPPGLWVRESSYVGMSRQILANSAMAGEADGTLPAVGRKPAISS